MTVKCAGVLISQGEHHRHRDRDSSLRKQAITHGSPEEEWHMGSTRVRQKAGAAAESLYEGFQSSDLDEWGTQGKQLEIA